MSERVAIVGSRAHPDTSIVRAYVRALPKGTVVITGGAAGVDAVAADEARRCGLRCIEHTPMRVGDAVRVVTYTCVRGDDRREVATTPLAPGSPYRDALLYRNTMIAVGCTRAAAFPDGSRGGTWDAVRQMGRFRRPVEVVLWIEGARRG